jgi:uncharacterized membrane protein YccC
MTAPLPSATATIASPQLAETATASEDHPWAALAFSLKTFLAGLLALFFAFWLGLDQPRWALLTVYVVSQPESGLVLAKSFYRALGTIAGGLVATLLVLTFAQYETLFLASLAVWAGVCNFAARLARNFMSYGFLLAGYTVAIVGISAALNPNATYTLVIARLTEISLGIACAALVSRLVLPRELAPKLLTLARQVIDRARRFGMAAIDPATDNDRFAADRIQLVQDLAALDGMRASAYFESADARRLNEPVRQVTAAALNLCAIAEDAACRNDSPFHSSEASRLSSPALILNTNDTPAENFAVVSALLSASYQRAVFDAETEIARAESALEGKSRPAVPSVPLTLWSDPVPAVLTGARTALAIAITSAFWIVTAWPTGPTAIIIAATACILFASMARPVTISVAGAGTILVAAIPVFVTLFYLLPLASDFVSMALALAPLMLFCGFIMAQPRIGPLGQLSGVYFAVSSNIDNVMNYNTVAFLNTSIAILFSFGVALVLFGTVFPETPSQASRRFRHQLLLQLGRFSKVRESSFSSYAYGLCDQLATTFTRVKEEPLAARHCYAMTMTALSTGYAIDRLKKALDADRLAPRIRRQIEILLDRISETFLKPSHTSLTTRAWEARALRCHSLREARASAETAITPTLGSVLVGCEALRFNLLKARILLSEPSDAR